MSTQTIAVTVAGAVAEIALNDPDKRNAMTLPMFDALDQAFEDISQDHGIRVLLIRGNGPAFCAGFDLAAALNDERLLPQLIIRLGALTRALRRLPQIVVGAVHGAAIAGGCAMLSACDFVFVAADATLGYPVHRLGISPAVTIPTLQQVILPGPARALLMGGELISGLKAHRIGLASHLVPNASDVHAAAREHCKQLAAKGAHALRTTKAWLNELDGSLDDWRFDQPVAGSTGLSGSQEMRDLLERWQQDRRG